MILRRLRGLIAGFYAEINMTPDNEFFMLLGGGIVGIGTLVIAVVIRMLNVRSDLFRNLRDD